MDQSAAIPFLVVLITSVLAAATDVWKFKVYNVLTLPFFLCGVVYHVWHGGTPELVTSLLGALFGFSMLFFFYVVGGMGAGDVKFMAGVGAWLGFQFTLVVFVAASVAAALYAIGLMVLFGSAKETWVNFQIACHRIAVLGRYLAADDRVETEVVRDDRRQRLIPFTAMVALGLIAVLAIVRLM
jgi:prepilin peptidase CpaA